MFGKVLKVFKKGAKAASKPKKKGTAAAGGFEWPSGVRVGIYGHDNSGKTVYYTVLNEECKISKKLQISVTDNATAGQLLTNYRSIWGVGTATDVGTVVDLREEKKFPDPTKGDKILQFNAIVDRKKKIPVVTYDYDGKAVSISGGHDLSEKVIDFMSGCKGILFFYDPKMLGAESRTQTHVASFVNLLERLAPLNRRLPIPIALVVTKADILPGFSSDSQSVLISAEDEHFLAEDYEVFLDRVLTSNKIASNSAWAGAVRDILVKLKEFLKVVVGRTLDFQIFFVSSTGQQPEKIGTDVGRSIYKPPPKMRPVGIKEPFYWILNSLGRSRRISKIRTVAKYVAVLSLIWVVVFSLPFLYHFKWVLPRTTRVEDNILKQYSYSRAGATKEERTKIKSAYRKYENAWTVKWLYDRFLVPARKIRSIYDKDILGAEIRELDKTIQKVAVTVQDAAGWPKPDLSTDSLRLTPGQKALEAALDGFHQWDSTSVLFARSGRALKLWDLFKNALLNPSDSAWAKIVGQVESDSSFYGREVNSAEQALGKVLKEAAAARQEKVDKKQTVQEAGTELDALIAEINQNQSPEYLLGTAVRELRKLKAKLSGNPARQQDVERIKTYLSQADRFNKSRQQYGFSLTYCPEGYHIHILVKKGGKTGDWQQGKLYRKGGKGYSITWRAGDHIYIALDKTHQNPADETWGEKSTDLKILDNPYAIFDMNGEIEFASGQKISITFDPDPKRNLPKF